LKIYILGEIGLVDVLKLPSISKQRKTPTHLTFNESGSAFVFADGDGNVIYFSLTKPKYAVICKNANPTCLYFEERMDGLIFIGFDDNTIGVFNLSKKYNKLLNS
jgi:hypothetical protein